MRIRVFIFLLSQLIFLSAFSQTKQSPRLVLPIGHGGSISLCEYSFDGEFALSVGFGGLKIYDASKRKEIYSLQSSEYNINYAKFSRNGEYIVAACSDENIRVFSVHTGEEVKSIDGHYGQVTKAIFSNDDKLIISGSQYGTLKIYNFELDSIIFSSEKAGWVTELAFSPDCKYAVIGNSSGLISVLKTTNGENVNTKKKLSGWIKKISFSEDGNVFAAVSDRDNEIVLFETKTGKVLKVIEGNKKGFGNNDVNINTKSDLILVASNDKTATLYQISNGLEILKIQTHTAAVKSACFSPDENLILTCSYDKTARVFNSRTGSEIAILGGHNGTVNSAVFSPDCNVVLTGCDDGKARVFNLKNNCKLEMLSKESIGFENLKFSSDGKFIFQTNYNSSLVYDFEKSKPTKFYTDKKSFVFPMFSSDGKLLITASEDYIIKIFDLEKNYSPIECKGHNRRISTYAISNNSKFLVSAGMFDKRILLFSVSDGKEIMELMSRSKKGNSDYASSIVFSSDDQFVLIGFTDDSFSVFDIGNGMEIISGTGSHKYGIDNVVFSKNGNFIMLHDDSKIDFFDFQSGSFTSVLNLYGHRGTVNSINLSPNNKLVLSGSLDCTARIYEISSGKEIQVFRGHNQDIVDAVFSPDGKFIVTTGADHKTILWDVETGKILYTRLQLENNDWLVYDEDYRFDGSPGAIEKLYFTCGLEIIELGQMKDALYVPGLAEKIVNGEDINYVKLGDLDICGALPLIEKTIENESGWKFIVEQRRWPIVRADVKVDGKIVKSIPSNQLKFEDGISEISLSLSEMQHFFVGGKENVISISAVTSQNGSEIKSRGIDVFYLAEEPKDPPRMFMLMIGVNDYKDDALDLVFPAQDARSLGNAVELSAEKLLGKENVEVYHVASKTQGNEVYTTPEREGIMKALKEIGSKAKANDLLFIFFAGHGVMQGQSDKSFTFLTADASQINQIGISTTDLISWLSPEGPFKMLPNKTILVYDACNSGQAAKELIAAMARNDDDTERLRQIEELGDKSGLFILSASAPNKPAYELPQLGQGLLTYSLLYTLKNNPNIIDLGQDGKGYLNLQKWFLESEREQNQRVLSLGLKQEAQPYGTGNIKLGVVDDDVRNAIQLIDEKPLVFCGNARDENDEDPLELKSLINDYFENAAARGLSAPLAFVSAETPNANVVKLIYSIDSNQVKCRVLFFKNKVKTNEVILDSSKDEIVPKIVETITSTIKI